MNIPKRLVRPGLILAALILLTAACQSDDSPAASSPVPTLTPTPTRSLPPTWTPAPPSQDLPASTLVPTFTPRPSATITPGVTPGVTKRDDGSLVVIIEEQALNDAIRAVYQNAPPEQISMAPVIRFPYSGRAVIDMVFFNSFLNQRGTVNARVLFDVRGGGLAVSEIVDEREREGILVADESIRLALTLAENGINNAVMALVEDQPDDYQIVSAQIHIGRMDVILQRSGQITPIG